MSARSRAEARLTRPAPDLSGWDAREPARRVADRDRPLPEPRPAPGDALPIHPDAIRELKPKNPARPAPNAPLLMRVVRTPFALEPAKVAKVRLVEPYVEPAPREKLGRPGEAWREAMATLSDRPMRSISHRPEPRPRLRRHTPETP